jgi:transposase InsO family protein
MLWRIQNGELEGVHPKVIVLLAGTNNVGNSPASDAKVSAITRGMKALLDAMREKAPRAMIIVMGILPRNDGARPTAVMPSIHKINEQIAKFADGKTIRYLNINDKLADKAGKLFEGMTGDRLHLSLKGYQVWADVLKPLLTELLGPPAKEDHAPPPTGDPAAPNEAWRADSTSLPTGPGGRWRAAVEDLDSRRGVGWSRAARLESRLAVDALARAVGRRLPGEGLLAPSDRDRPDASDPYQSLLARHGLRGRRSRRADGGDNAPRESCFASWPKERVAGADMATRAAARAALVEDLEVFSHTRRRHASLAYVSPAATRRSISPNWSKLRGQANRLSCVGHRLRFGVPGVSAVTGPTRRSGTSPGRTPPASGRPAGPRRPRRSSSPAPARP